MNKQEYYSYCDSHKCRGNEYYKYVQKLLSEWKLENHIPSNKKCVVHHRNDNEEMRAYNDEHYELWGHNLDGTFEYGKYVLFMTNAEHTAYHHTGKYVSPETRLRISQNHANVSGENNPMFGNIGRITGDKNPMKDKAVRDKVAKALKGRQFSAETRAKMSTAKKGIKLSESAKEKMRETRRVIDTLWERIKNNNSELSYKEFRKALKNGDSDLKAQFVELLNYKTDKSDEKS